MQGVYRDVPLGATPVEGMVGSGICLAQGEVKHTASYSLCSTQRVLECTQCSVTFNSLQPSNCSPTAPLHCPKVDQVRALTPGLISYLAWVMPGEGLTLGGAALCIQGNLCRG